MSSLSEPLLFAIRAATGITLQPASVRSVTGGSINSCFRVQDRRDRPWFLKVNVAECAEMFAAEAEGLRELRAARALRVPEPAAHGLAGQDAWLLMEWLDLESGSELSAALLGAGLALQHRHVAGRYGWHRDNTIGSTLQRNPWTEQWPEFWGRQRLAVQIALAARQGYREIASGGQALLERLPELLAGHAPSASLLHGDLWSGNWAMTAAATPVIFDPAVYYGDREADIAMSELFGGFPPQFYAAYEAAWPLDPGYRRRKDIYNLYHVLNHLNLFGGSYLGDAVVLLDRLLRETP